MRDHTVFRAAHARRHRRTSAVGGGGGGGGSFAAPDIATWTGDAGWDWLAAGGGFGACHSIVNEGGNNILRRLLPVDGAGNDPDPAAGTYSAGQTPLPGIDRRRLYTAVRLRWSARHTPILKGFRYVTRDGLFGLGGTYWDYGVLGCGTDGGGTGLTVKHAVGLFLGSQAATCPAFEDTGLTVYAENLAGSWFRLAWDYDWSNSYVPSPLGPGYAQFRFWFALDGATEWTPIRQRAGNSVASDSYPSTDAQWIAEADTTLPTPLRIATFTDAEIGQIRHFDQLNAGNTVEANLDTDWIALSTQPISPTGT
jgi:hypothetical protein